jgi:bleomycin hydrolase
VEVVGKDDKNFNTAGAERKSNAFSEPTKELKITEELRQDAYDNKTTTDDHGMHIVGAVKDQTGKRYYTVKNSWGADRNFVKGYFYCSLPYYLYKTTSIMVHRNAVPKAILAKLKS